MSPHDDRNFSQNDGLSLREYIDMRFNTIDMSLALVREQMEKRLEGMNEFRQQLNEQTTRFITREELDARCIPCKEDVRSLRESRAESHGKASTMSVFIATAIALCGLIVGAVALLLKM